MRIGCLPELRKNKIKLLLVIFFLSFLYSSISFSNPITNRDLSPSDKASKRDIDFSAFSIPEEFGAIEDVFMPENQSVPAGDQPFVIYIKDAHANPEAQGKIKLILEFLNQTYGISLISVEGAVGELQPGLFNFFPEYPDVNFSMIKDLAQKGELTGCDLFALEAPKDVVFLGGEDSVLYRKSLLDFRKILSAQNEIKKLNIPIKRTIAQLEGFYIYGDLKKFLDLVDRYESGREELFPYLREMLKWGRKTLKSDLNNKGAEPSFPNLVRFKRLYTTQAVDQLQTPPRDIDRSALFSELEMLKAMILEKLIATPEAKEFVGTATDWKRLVKLVGLKWTSADQEAFYRTSARPDLSSVLNRIQKLRTLHKPVIQTHIDVKESELLDAWVKRALRFYAFAEKRDRVLAENLTHVIFAQRKKHAVLVAGGFHREGITGYLKKNRIAYAVISPNFTSDFSSSLYEKVMSDRHADLYPVFGVRTSTINDADLLMSPAIYNRLRFASEGSKQVSIAIREMMEIGVRGLREHLLTSDVAVNVLMKALATPIFSENNIRSTVMSSQTIGLEFGGREFKIHFSGEEDHRVAEKENPSLSKSVQRNLRMIYDGIDFKASIEGTRVQIVQILPSPQSILWTDLAMIRLYPGFRLMFYVNAEQDEIREWLISVEAFYELMLGERFNPGQLVIRSIKAVEPSEVVGKVNQSINNDRGKIQVVFESSILNGKNVERISLQNRESLVLALEDDLDQEKRVMKLAYLRKILNELLINDQKFKELAGERKVKSVSEFIRENLTQFLFWESKVARIFRKSA